MIARAAGSSAEFDDYIVNWDPPAQLGQSPEDMISVIRSLQKRHSTGDG